MLFTSVDLHSIFMKKQLLAPIFFFLYTYSTHSQSISHSEQVWGGYMTSVRLNDKWALWNDAHYVPTSFWINRHGFSYMFTERIVGTFGYAWLSTATGATDKLVREEHRPWGQINFLFPINETYSFNHRFRYDYRIREDLEGGMPINGSYTGYSRLRFMTSLRRPLIGSKLASNRPFISLNNEILVNFGQAIEWNYFDQNRAWINVGYQYQNFTFQVGYMHRFVQFGQVGHMATYHTLLFWVTHAMDVRNKKGRKQYEDTQLLHREP